MSDENGGPDTEQLRAEIDHTRDELAETVEALAAKADVKGRASDKVHEVQETAKARARDLQEAAKVRALTARTTARTVATEQAQLVAAQAKLVTEQAKVKSQQVRTVAAERAHTTQETVQQQRQEKPWLLPALGGLAGLLTAVLVWLRRRNR